MGCEGDGGMGSGGRTGSVTERDMTGLGNGDKASVAHAERPGRWRSRQGGHYAGHERGSLSHYALQENILFFFFEGRGIRFVI